MKCQPVESGPRLTIFRGLGNPSGRVVIDSPDNQGGPIRVYENALQLTEILCKEAWGMKPARHICEFVERDLVAGIPNDSWAISTAPVLDSIARAFERIG